MKAFDRKVVLLDMDGVLSFCRPVGVGDVDALPDSLHQLSVPGTPWMVMLVPEALSVVKALVEFHDVIWCTGWRFYANRVGEALGLPHLVTITDGGVTEKAFFATRGACLAPGVSWKSSEVELLAPSWEGRDVFWIEDFWTHGGSDPDIEGVTKIDTSSQGYLSLDLLDPEVWPEIHEYVGGVS